MTKDNKQFNKQFTLICDRRSDEYLKENPYISGTSFETGHYSIEIAKSCCEKMADLLNSSHTFFHGDTFYIDTNSIMSRKEETKFCRFCGSPVVIQTIEEYVKEEEKKNSSERVADKNCYKEDLVDILFKVGVLKFGDFTLKSGIKSPFYLDHRLFISHPKDTLTLIQNMLIPKIKELGLEFDLVAGIPEAGNIFSSPYSIITNTPAIMIRKKIKDYGMKKEIEGEWKEGQTVLVFDDLMTGGDSKIEVINQLSRNGLVVKDIVVLVNRTPFPEKLKPFSLMGANLHFLISMDEIAKIALRKKLIPQDKFVEYSKFIHQQRRAYALSGSPF